MGIGGDDFLTKPIEPDHLIAAVNTRVERYQKLRALMIQDGLTGLLNHSTTKERLAQEVVRARRHNLPLSFAILDLDHFKVVNDTYGHATGDRVLKSLAHMLKQRLRSSDSIGRFGGEEFAVILPNTEEKAAVKVMNELCSGFAKIHHHTGDAEFTVTFSCGVSSFPHCETAEALTMTADAALYEAKAAGRNCVLGSCDCKNDPLAAVAAPPSPSIRAGGLSHAALYQNLIKNANSVIIRIDRQGVITFANDFALNFFGYSSDEIIGKNIVGTLIAPTDASGFDLQAKIQEIIAYPERYIRNENENLRKNGEKVWVAWSNSALTNESGALVEVLCIGNDITARKNAEANLTRMVNQLTTLNRISQAVMNQQELSQVVSAVKSEIQHLFGACEVDLLLLSEDHRFLLPLHPTGPELQWRVELETQSELEQVLQSGRSVFQSQCSFLSRQSPSPSDQQAGHGTLLTPLITFGKTIGLMVLAFKNETVQVLDEEIELAEMVGATIASVIDSSRSLMAEQRQRQYLEALMSNLPTAVVMVDPQSRILTWNPAAEHLFGYSLDEVVGQDTDSLLATEEYRQEAARYSDETLNGGKLVHAITSRMRKDGTPVDVELRAVPVFADGTKLGSVAIYHDITELQRARRDAEAANEAKSAFLATMSHEIRTPLNAIIGMTTLLLDTPLTKEQLDFSETIRNSSDALLAIINDILDFSKIEAGRMELEEQPFDLRECLESALDLVATRATEKGIDLAYILDPAVPAVLISDATRLRQILLNLLSNAMKFTSAGEVVLSVMAEKVVEEGLNTYQIHFVVRDTGIGIPAEKMDRLFRSFSQVDASTTRKYGGTGLGLAISKRLAELMGGKMWARSEGVPGQGSEFHFTILAEPSNSPLPVYLNVRQPELSGRKVLIVDDNATNRYILMRQVLSWGMLPQETADPLQALQWVREGREFDIALLDMQMPEMDGATLAGEIQTTFASGREFPLVMLTSLGTREYDPGSATFAAFLTKPIKPAVLYTVLLKVFGQQVPQSKPEELPDTEKAASEKLQPLSILLAEDNNVNQKVALLLLERIGLRADVASNGFEVLQALERQPYQVILMDVQMPEMDGLETTRRVRRGEWLSGELADTFTRQPYIIAMTANAMQGDRETCLAAGMDDYISKPIRVEELRRALIHFTDVLKTAQASGIALQATGQADWPVIDEELFRRFHEDFGENGEVQELIEAYLAESEELVGSLARSMSEGRVQETRLHAHSLKSSSMLFGAVRLSERCKVLELDAKAGRLPSASAASEIAAEFQAVKAELETKLLLSD